MVLAITVVCLPSACKPTPEDIEAFKGKLDKALEDTVDRSDGMVRSADSRYQSMEELDRQRTCSAFVRLDCGDAPTLCGSMHADRAWGEA